MSSLPYPAPTRAQRDTWAVSSPNFLEAQARLLELDHQALAATVLRQAALYVAELERLIDARVDENNGLHRDVANYRSRIEAYDATLSEVRCVVATCISPGQRQPFDEALSRRAEAMRGEPENVPF